MEVPINGEVNINENAIKNENLELIIEEIENNDYDYYTIQLMNDFFNYYNYNKIINQMYDIIIFIIKHPYLLYFYLLMSDLLNNTIDNILLFKLFIEKNINEFIKLYIDNNKIENIYLINNEKFLLLPKIDKLNKEIFEEILINNNCNLELYDDSCIVIKYRYESKVYRLYINYKDIQHNSYEFPLNIQKIKEDLDTKYNRSTILFFKNECNEIKEARINDIDIKEIIGECNGPFYDFGLIHNHKVYVKHLVKELDLDELKELEIKYTNFYMDEDEMALIDHVIHITNINDYIQSEIINKKLI